MTHSAVIFPGQGAQSVGMGRDVYDSNAAARRVFDLANDVLGFDLTSLCIDGSAERLEQTDVQQPAIFVVSVALWEAYVAAGGDRNGFQASAGLSLGEYTALHIAGAVSFEDGLRLVRRRGQLMQEAADRTPGGMVTLVGADEDTAKALCEKAAQDGVLVPANFNCPGQIVIAGSLSACGTAVQLAGEFGVRAVSLPVAGAFHSALMASAAEQFQPVLARTEFRRPERPVARNVDAEYHGGPAEIREFLDRQLTSPVRWQACVERMIQDGARHFVEIGPGRVLTGLLRKIDRDVRATNVSTAASIDTAVVAIRDGIT